MAKSCRCPAANFTLDNRISPACKLSQPPCHVLHTCAARPPARLVAVQAACLVAAPRRLGPHATLCVIIDAPGPQRARAALLYLGSQWQLGRGIPLHGWPCCCCRALLPILCCIAVAATFISYLCVRCIHLDLHTETKGWLSRLLCGGRDAQAHWRRWRTRDRCSRSPLNHLSPIVASSATTRQAAQRPRRQTAEPLSAGDASAGGFQTSRPHVFYVRSQPALSCKWSC